MAVFRSHRPHLAAENSSNYTWNTLVPKYYQIGNVFFYAFWKSEAQMYIKNKVRPGKCFWLRRGKWTSHWPLEIDQLTCEQNTDAQRSSRPEQQHPSGTLIYFVFLLVFFFIRQTELILILLSLTDMKGNDRIDAYCYLYQRFKETVSATLVLFSSGDVGN